MYDFIAYPVNNAAKNRCILLAQTFVSEIKIPDVTAKKRRNFPGLP